MDRDRDECELVHDGRHASGGSVPRLPARGVLVCPRAQSAPLQCGRRERSVVAHVTVILANSEPDWHGPLARVSGRYGSGCSPSG